jgi:hypothetical protein
VSPEEVRLACARLHGTADFFFLVKQGYFYRPGAAGYTVCISEAGCWPEAEARERECSKGLSDEVRAVPAPLACYEESLDLLHALARHLGLHDRSRPALRVKWINALRMVVSRRMPKNHVGAALVSDVDLMTAEPLEVAEAILRACGEWKEVAA